MIFEWPMDWKMLDSVPTKHTWAASRSIFPLCLHGCHNHWKKNSRRILWSFSTTFHSLNWNLPENVRKQGISIPLNVLMLSFSTRSRLRWLHFSAFFELWLISIVSFIMQQVNLLHYTGWSSIIHRKKDRTLKWCTRSSFVITKLPVAKATMLAHPFAGAPT